MKSKKILALVISAGMLSSFAFSAAGCEKCFASSNDYVAAEQYIDSDTADFLYTKKYDEEKVDTQKKENSAKQENKGSFFTKAAKGVGKFAASVGVYGAVGAGAVEVTDKIGYTDSSQLLDRSKNVLVLKDLVKDGWNVKGVMKNAAINRDKLEITIKDAYTSAYTIPVCLAVGGVISWLGNKLFGFRKFVGNLISVVTGSAMAFSKKDSFYNSAIKPVVNKVVDKIAEKL